MSLEKSRLTAKKNQNGVRLLSSGAGFPERGPRNGRKNAVTEGEQLVRLATERLAALPDTRPEKVAEAKKKITRGYYGSPEVLEKIALRFLEEMGIS